MSLLWNYFRQILWFFSVKVQTVLLLFDENLRGDLFSKPNKIKLSFEHSSISCFFTCYCLKMASKIGNISKFTKELENIYKLVCRWHTVYISWTLVVVPKFLKPQNFKTTFHKNLTCIIYLSELTEKNSLPWLTL